MANSETQVCVTISPDSTPLVRSSDSTSSISTACSPFLVACVPQAAISCHYLHHIPKVALSRVVPVDLYWAAEPCAMKGVIPDEIEAARLRKGPEKEPWCGGRNGQCRMRS